MKLHLATLLAASELLNLLQNTNGLLMQPSKKHATHSKNILSPSGSSKSAGSPFSSPYSKTACLVLYAESNDDRIFKAGGGIPLVPTGELKLFDPGQEGMKGGTTDLAERLQRGVSYGSTADNGAVASSSHQEPAKPELSLFDPGQEGMKGGTSDFAERLKAGANFQQAQSLVQDLKQVNGGQVNGSASQGPAEAVVETPPQQSAQPAVVATTPANPRPNWPYQPMVASSSPAYPNVGVGRGRSAALRRAYQDAIQNNCAAPITAIQAAQVANGATKSTSATTASSDSNAQRAIQQQKAVINSSFWGKQSNWWDNSSGSMLDHH